MFHQWDLCCMTSPFFSLPITCLITVRKGHWCHKMYLKKVVVSGSSVFGEYIPSYSVVRFNPGSPWGSRRRHWRVLELSRFLRWRGRGSRPRPVHVVLSRQMHSHIHIQTFKQFIALELMHIGKHYWYIGTSHIHIQTQASRHIYLNMLKQSDEDA